MDMPELSIDNLPAGMTYEPEKGLANRSMVARKLADHPVYRRPTRHFATCNLALSGNTMLSMHLARIEPGGYKCRHRHFDETCGYVVEGRGYGEYRQSDDAELMRFDWKAGDLIVTPCNCWHQHLNASQTDYARQISFRNSPVINSTVIGPKEGPKSGNPNKLDIRFPDRFDDDQKDYFQQREEIAPGVIRTNYVSQVVDEKLPKPDGSWGEGVSLQHYIMGGQRMLDMVLIGIRAGGQMRPHRSISEEGIVVLAGEGRTEIWDDTGRRHVIEWSAGDLISPPFNAWRSHHANPGSELRLLMARNVVMERCLGVKMGQIGRFECLPVRFPERVEPGL